MFPSQGIPSPSPSAAEAEAGALWRPDLATGIPEIDRQHRELLVQIAELGEAARTGDLPLAENVLSYLERYAARHFATEERFMLAYGYPNLETHWSLHMAFASELARRKAEYAAHRSLATLIADLGQWMARWLNEHVLEEDARMARFLRGHAGAASSAP
jgi:hemerythrin-like metal-binding protein